MTGAERRRTKGPFSWVGVGFPNFCKQMHHLMTVVVRNVVTFSTDELIFFLHHQLLLLHKKWPTIGTTKVVVLADQAQASAGVSRDFSLTF